MVCMCRSFELVCGVLFSFTDVLFVAELALHQVNHVFRVSVNVVNYRSGFTCRVESVSVLSIRYMSAHVEQLLPHC